MPRTLNTHSLNQIEEILRTHPYGLREGEIQQECAERGINADRRTFYRWLRLLSDKGLVEILGRGRATTYRIRQEATSLGAGEEPEGLPLSDLGGEVCALVRRPITLRKPVGYNARFLEVYVPNQSSYLSKGDRKHLHELGRSPFRERPAGTYARDILNRLLIDLSWASSQLEGNTYSRLDTQNLIEFGQAAEGKDQVETQMILNHKAAIEMLVEDAERIGFDLFTICNLHALLSENLLADPSSGGRLRKGRVGIAGSVFEPLGVPQLIEENFRMILEKTEAIEDPFEQAFFFMVQVPYLQPFVDVNKRVSRLGANIPFIKRNLSPLSFIEVPTKDYVDGVLAVYELNRVELLRDVFLWAYERSCQRYVAAKDSLPQPDPLRLRLRAELAEVVGEIVRKGHAIDTPLIRKIARPLVPDEDLDQFVAMAFSDLNHLHEGNLMRYKLRPSEFLLWKETTQV